MRSVTLTLRIAGACDGESCIPTGWKSVTTAVLSLVLHPTTFFIINPLPGTLCWLRRLTRLRLVNRSNLGINRMFSALLIEGKEPPHIREIGESVLVGFPKRNLNAAFRLFVAEESEHGRNLGVDKLLLLLQYLLQHPEVDTGHSRSLLANGMSPKFVRGSQDMESAGYIEHGGKGRGTYWCIHPDLYNRLAEGGQGEVRRRIDWEAAKTRVLSILMERARRG